MNSGVPQHWESHRAALIIAHPGHELQVHHWLERARPVVLVLTDGSGHAGQSHRLRCTRQGLDRMGGKTGSFFGRISDRELYRAVLGGDTAFFTALAEEIAAILNQEDVDYVVGDAVEGFNPGHDIGRLLLNTALSHIERRSGRCLQNFEFSIEGLPDTCPEVDRAEAILLGLDDDAFERKFAAVKAYPGLETDVTRLLATHAAPAFRIECLRPVRYGFRIADRFNHPACYERYGEEKVRAGIYSEVIRFRDHVAPLAEHLGAAATRSGR